MRLRLGDYKEFKDSKFETNGKRTDRTGLHH